MSYERLPDYIDNTPMAPLLKYASEAWFLGRNNGDLPRWRAAQSKLPQITPSIVDLKESVSVGCAADLGTGQKDALTQALEGLIPWRKGPFTLFDVHIDTEWHSDWKWERLRHHISPLHGRKILDVGCGNGYHCFRMVGDGAALAIGIDPQIAYAIQSQMIKHYIPDTPVFVLPTTLEELPSEVGGFDTVFSMGVLYHRRSPIDHLLQLRNCLRPGGELVLETLIVDGPLGYSLTPEGRYSRMNNVWFLPSVDTALNWLQRCGYTDCRLVDTSITTTDEQRTTDWMRFQSLAESLDPSNSSLTVEGHPAPKRGVFVATAPR
ncbi:MAG: tRNA 5-methoxyuridine(34)/uridine 5-oxyacetic acid(34) synthase CmoB [Pseudohongiellaceae bacterium]|nr:tRNA 5-methoxyuridine(34)/uridine 5-oxyacetic acid(34) synthase CmoB [Pseudohongiellaceae bacterium]